MGAVIVEDAGQDTGQDTASTNGKSGGRQVGVPNVPVEWKLTPVNALPVATRGARVSAVHGELEQVRLNPGQAFEVAVYGDDARAKTSAHGKANALRKQYKADEGWRFSVGDSQSEPGRIALFAQYGG